MALLGALLAVSLPNILHAIFGLGLSLIGVAGLFFTLGSPFVAAMQILIYVGGISVAMVFAVMLSQVINPSSGETKKSIPWGAFLASGLFLAAMAPVLLSTRFGVAANPEDQATSVATIGMSMLQEYNVVFETLSVVLLLAIVGAICIAQPDKEAK
jgi:NADH:ubiquinone oxidoreductase subunit 6 (subunit J)